MVWLDDKEKVLALFRKYKYVLGIVIVGILLMLIPEQEEIAKEEVHQQEIAKESLQNSLEKILTKIHGAGKVNVLLTEYTGEEVVYQLDETISGSSDSSDRRAETVTLTDSDRNEKGMVRKVISPVYQGALVVCQGADSAAVRLAIVEAVSRLTGLATNQISVLKMK